MEENNLNISSLRSIFLFGLSKFKIIEKIKLNLAFKYVQIFVIFLDSKVADHQSCANREELLKSLHQ